MLVGRRDHLVLGAEAEAGEHDVAAVRGRGGQRELGRLRTDERRQRLPDELAQREGSVEVRLRRCDPPADPRSSSAATASRVGPRQRAERPGVEIRDPLEHREQRARLLEGHPALRSTG